MVWPDQHRFDPQKNTAKCYVCWFLCTNREKEYDYNRSEWSDLVLERTNCNPNMPVVVSVTCYLPRLVLVHASARNRQFSYTWQYIYRPTETNENRRNCCGVGQSGLGAGYLHFPHIGGPQKSGARSRSPRDPVLVQLWPQWRWIDLSCLPYFMWSQTATRHSNTRLCTSDCQSGTHPSHRLSIILHIFCTHRLPRICSIRTRARTVIVAVI